VFHRGYEGQSNNEVFIVKSVSQKLGKPLYYLETCDKKENIIGGFYERELTTINSDIFQIEKVLKSRKRGGVVEHFVKWKGYDNRHNSWITFKDITQVLRGRNE